MKDTYVSDLQPNQIIVSDFLVQAKELRSKKAGGNYLALALSDKTGEVEAKIWDNVEQVEPTFARDDFVKVKGAVQLYQNRPQLTVHKLKRLEDREVDLADFFPRSARDPEEMWRELMEVVAAVEKVQSHQPPERGVDAAEVPEVGLLPAQVDEFRNLAVCRLKSAERDEAGSCLALEHEIPRERHADRAHRSVTPEYCSIAARFRFRAGRGGEDAMGGKVGSQQLDRLRAAGLDQFLAAGLRRSVRWRPLHGAAQLRSRFAVPVASCIRNGGAVPSLATPA